MTLRHRSYDDDAAQAAGLEEMLRRFDPLTEEAPVSAAAAAVGVGGVPAYLVAASNAAAETLAVAHFVCDGVADEVEIKAALAALPAFGTTSGEPYFGRGGRVVLSEGEFICTHLSVIVIPAGAALVGSGRSTVFRVEVGRAVTFEMGGDLAELGNMAFDRQGTGS